MSGNFPARRARENGFLDDNSQSIYNLHTLWHKLIAGPKSIVLFFWVFYLSAWEYRETSLGLRLISDLICLRNRRSIISDKDTAGNTCVHTLNAALATDSAASPSSCWTQAPCISSQCFFNNLATTLLFMGRMWRDKKCIVCL